MLGILSAPHSYKLTAVDGGPHTPGLCSEIDIHQNDLLTLHFSHTTGKKQGLLITLLKINCNMHFSDYNVTPL